MVREKIIIHNGGMAMGALSVWYYNVHPHTHIYKIKKNVCI